ncbi:MAG TPA: ThuA domain-containing protein [Coriobacteriia bacterium]
MSKRSGLRLAGTLVMAVALVLALGASAASAVETPRVAVVSSLISEHRDIAKGYIQEKDHSIRADMTVDALQSQGIPSTKIGDAQLLDLAALKQYDVVVFPRVTAMTKAQRLVVRQYVAEGGGVLFLFGTSRFDYSTGSYVPLVNLKWFGTTLAEFKQWEWGELSEIMQVRFLNDPATYKGFHVTGTDPFGNPVDLVGGKDDYNELVATYPGNTNVRVLATYQGSRTNDAGYPANNTPAMWTSLYYKGRMFYSGFQLYGMTRLNCPELSTAGSENYGTAASQGTKDQARALLANAVRWAGTPPTTADMSKSPLTGSAYSLDPTPRTVTIRTSATSVSRPRPFVLSGELASGVVGDPVVVYVKKPGKAYWTYSSKRLCYALASGGASWWYRYVPIARTSPAGTYYFKAAFGGDETRPSGVSSIITVRMR